MTAATIHPSPSGAWRAALRLADAADAADRDPSRPNRTRLRIALSTWRELQAQPAPVTVADDDPRPRD